MITTTIVLILLMLLRGCLLVLFVLLPLPRQLPPPPASIVVVASAGSIGFGPCWLDGLEHHGGQRPSGLHVCLAICLQTRCEVRIIRLRCRAGHALTRSQHNSGPRDFNYTPAVYRPRCSVQHHHGDFLRQLPDSEAKQGRLRVQSLLFGQHRGGRYKLPDAWTSPCLRKLFPAVCTSFMKVSMVFV